MTAEAETKDALDLVRLFLPRLLSVRVETTTDHTLKRLQDLLNSYLFQLGYNTDSAIVPQRYVDEIVRRGRIRHLGRARFDEIEPPQRTYKADLVYHYQLATAADNPLLEFLSYYHVAEHFFQEVFDEDLVRAVQDKITQPGFSSRRAKDIRALVTVVTKAVG